MAKRSARAASAGKVTALFDATEWDPLERRGDDDREQSYLRKVRPQSQNQRALMEAIERHSLGFLPGDMHEKLAPYLRPLYDALNERIGGKRVRQLMSEGAIEIAPIAYMRGRTLNNAFVLVDEAQNCTYGQIKMLLTRLGWHSTMVLTGDPDQTDLLEGLSGLSEIARRLEAIAEIAVIRLDERDIVRHPLVGEMLTVL